MVSGCGLLGGTEDRKAKPSRLRLMSLQKRPQRSPEPFRLVGHKKSVAQKRVLTGPRRPSDLRLAASGTVRTRFLLFIRAARMDYDLVVHENPGRHEKLGKI